MPELKNIIPTADELYAYYREHRPDPGIELSEHFDEFADVREAALRFECIEYLRRVDSIIWGGLNWMNALDRNHPFWNGTNLRPTIYKLFDFARMVLESEPDNIQAHWLLAVEDTFWGSNGFGQDWWLRLWRMGSVGAKWPIRAGLWNEMILGYDNDDVGRLLRQMGSPSEGRVYLGEIATTAQARLREWAGKQLESGYQQRA